MFVASSAMHKTRQLTYVSYTRVPLDEYVLVLAPEQHGKQHSSYLKQYLQIFTRLALAYLADALQLQPVARLPGRQSLRSSSTSALAVPLTPAGST